MFNRRPRTAAEKRLRSRTRARWTMWFVTAVCAVVGVGIGVDQLVTGGFGAFVDRPAGVGATGSSTAKPTTTAKKRPSSNNNQSSQPAPNPPDYVPPRPRGPRGPAFLPPPDGRRGAGDRGDGLGP